MVGKVFCLPVLGAVVLLCVDVVVLVGSWLDVGRIVGRITGVFASRASSRGGSTEAVGQQSREKGGGLE